MNNLERIPVRVEDIRGVIAGVVFQPRARRNIFLRAGSDGRLVELIGPLFHACCRISVCPASARARAAREPKPLDDRTVPYSSRTIDNVATSLAWIASHARTIATVDIQEPPLSTRPNMSPTREIPILAAPPQVSCRLRTLPARQWQRSSEKFAAGNPMTTQPRSASSAALESVRYR